MRLQQHLYDRHTHVTQCIQSTIYNNSQWNQQKLYNHITQHNTTQTIMSR